MVLTRARGCQFCTRMHSLEMNVLEHLRYLRHYLRHLRTREQQCHHSGPIRTSSLSSKVRAAGVNAYATTKDRHANKIIKEKGLNIGFKAITFGTYGAFGTATHKLIATATANSPCPVYSPWVRPSPKQHAYLLFGFTLARANARMLINAASKRSSAKNAVRTSRSRSP